MKAAGVLKATLALFASVTAGGYYILEPALKDIQITAHKEDREANEPDRYSR